MPTADEIRTLFLRFADRECRGVAPLYGALAGVVADDPDLLTLAATARPGQPVPNLLFAAVHQLLLAGRTDEPLARFYRSLTPTPAPPDKAPPAFQRFCRDHANAIRIALGARAVNTNEVQRCACLLPAFAQAARAGSPLHLIEIGASAGLNLRWDRYAYRYDGATRVGPADAGLVLDCEQRGAGPLDLPKPWPAIGRRIGIDPDAIDTGDPADVLWLKALIWPDRWERVQRLHQALAAAAATPIDMIRGDGAALLPGIAAGLPENGTAVVYHSFTLNQFPPAAKAAFARALSELAAARPIHLIALEWTETRGPLLTWSLLDGDRREVRALARCDAHGAWIEPIAG
jgi:hypothetical protein